SPDLTRLRDAPPVRRTGVGPFGEDYRRAAAPSREGLPERGVSPIGWLQTELAIGNQVHIPLHRSQKRQRRPARLPPGSNGFRSPLQSQAAIPSQAGTSC